MRIERPPRPELRPFIKSVWLSHSGGTACRERVLPSGEMHLAIRLSDHPVWIYQDASSATPGSYGYSVAAGPHASFYVKNISNPACSIGAVLRPGASLPLFGVKALELANRHARLDDLWGPGADSARSRILEAPGPEEQLDVFEAILVSRASGAFELHPAVAMALCRLNEGHAVRDSVRASGYSHRRLIQLFRDSVGLPPKLYARLRRFQRVLSVPMGDLSGLAITAGYSDQAHLHREFREFTGVTPSEYRVILPAGGSHLPVSPARS